MGDTWRSALGEFHGQSMQSGSGLGVLQLVQAEQPCSGHGHRAGLSCCSPQNQKATDSFWLCIFICGSALSETESINVTMSDHPQF